MSFVSFEGVVDRVKDQPVDLDWPKDYELRQLARSTAAAGAALK